MIEDKTVRKLRQQLDAALLKQKDEQAIELLGKLIEADKTAPRWPHKLGELYRKQGKRDDAINSYTKAADLYVDQGFIARAVAMAKTILDLDPKRIDILRRIDPEAAQKLHREQRPLALSARPPPLTHAAVLDETEITTPTARGPDRVNVARKPRAAKPEVAIAIPSIPSAAPSVPDLGSGMLALAEELTVAPDRKPNETRFSNAPPARAISVSFTDEDLAPRQAAPAPNAPPIASPSAKRLSRLPLFPLFAELPHQALVDLVTQAEVLEFSDGSIVLRRGEPADALYGIVGGNVEIIVREKQLKLTLGEGDVFGESSLLAGEKRHANVIARGHLVALKITRQTFNQVIATFPRLAEILLELLTRRLLTNLLQSSPLFQEFDAQSRQDLVRSFELRRAPKGMVFSEVGKIMDGLYINLTGELEVTNEGAPSPEIHGAGTLFGQASLLTRDPSSARIRALSNMLVLRLPTQAFHTIAMQYPGMLAHVSELSASSVANVAT